VTSDLLAALPPHLGERTRILAAGSVPEAARFVLYCMDGNLRATENPPLEVAIRLADAAGLPLVVLFELREAYPYASDRHHRFLLEGARDTLARLRDRGIATVAHVHRPGRRHDADVRLAAQAAAVVLDDVPTRPYRARRQALLDVLPDPAPPPVYAVDGGCLVPMRLVGRAYDRAYKFRNATKELRTARLGNELPQAAPRLGRLHGALPFDGDDLDAWDLGDLTAACEIDHAVPPVPEFPGGETAAQAHWAHWRDTHLAGYAAKRNDALAEDAVSRLSPYLRHGMIAATQVAREAAAQPGKGPDKFLDELLIWREMSWAYAFYQPDHDRLDAVLPDWARETLERRRIDPRPTLYDWETLARSRTDDPLWNAAQAGYTRRGYLHNNLRMTWGKELLAWTDGPDACAEILVDLNNRFALDGGDPNSYQGLFWCLGAFDRPFEPERKIFGTVRHRSTEVHAKRLDVAAYTARQVRAAPGRLPRVAVIGGGLAGLACARTLADHGVEVTLFDKGRRPGGRTAAKRLGDGHYADHGAPCLDLDDARLAPWVKAWRQCGLLEPWTDSQGWTRLAAQPHGRGLAAHLAEDLDLRQGVAAAALTGGPGSWHVHSADGALEGPFERVVVAAPAPQTAALLQPVAPDLADRAATAAYASSMSAVASLPAPVSDAPAWGSYDDAVLAVAIRDSVKPGRPATQPETWVLHATTAWSAAHLDDDHEAIAQALWRAFVDRHAPTASPDALIGHRWRYARVTQPLGQDCLFDAERGIGACGDWCLGPDTGDALLSGFAMAGRLFAAEPAIEARGRPRQVRDAA
jgi:hypothetical protein